MTNNSVNSKNPILQVVTATVKTLLSQTTVMPVDDTIPQITEGDEVLTATITPQFSTSILEIVFTGNSIVPGNETRGGLALFQDSTAGALAAKSISTKLANASTYFLQHIMTSGTTSSTTFRIRYGPLTAGSSRVNGTSGGSQLMGGVGQTILKIIEYKV